jgi:uncharacterized protein (UPF0305 family)
MKEPAITINGLICNKAQAMTMRCAVENFAAYLHNRTNAELVGDVSRLYLDRITELRKMMTR